jgi:hypothetical protein
MPEIPSIAYMPFFVGIFAIGMAMGSKMLKAWMFHRQEMERLKQSRSVGASNVDSSVIDQLRQEIMQLRDTTTQYDMSVEKTLQDIKQRLAYLESVREVQHVQAAPLPELQQVGSNLQS